MLHIAHEPEPNSNAVGHFDKNKADQHRLSEQTKRAYKLKKFVDELEKFEAQKSAITEAIKATYDAASSEGYDKKALKQVIADRPKDQQELALFNDKVTDLKALIEWAEKNPRWKKAV